MYVHPGSTYYYYRFFSIITFYYTYTYLSRVRRVRRHLVTPLKSEIKPTQVIDLNAEMVVFKNIFFLFTFLFSLQYPVRNVHKHMGHSGHMPYTVFTDETTWPHSNTVAICPLSTRAPEVGQYKK